MKDVLSYLFEYKKLSREEAKAILLEITSGQYSEAEIAAFITVFNMRTITIDELAGFRDALLETCTSIDLSEFNTIDLCGTGGDGKDTFNISSLSTFVVAGAGAKVSKHGNYGASSSCGSSNVMEYLGYGFSSDADKLKRELDQCGITFIHAPLFNPAMKHVAPVRKALRLKSFFNMLGPMVNPTRPQNQLVGVFSLELARMYNYLYQKSEKNYTILHSLDGYDEISLTGNFKVLGRNINATMSPSDLNLKRLQPQELASSGDIKGTAKIFMDVISGKGTTAQESAVIANSAMALQTYFPEKDLETCLENATQSLKGGAALKVFNKLIELQ